MIDPLKQALLAQGPAPRTDRFVLRRATQQGAGRSPPRAARGNSGTSARLRWAFVALFAVLLAGPSRAAEGPPVLDEAALRALAAMLRPQGADLGDLRDPGRLRVKRPNNEYAALVEDPLAGLDRAAVSAWELGRDLVPGRPAGFESLFVGSREATPTDPCTRERAGRSGQGLASQHIAASEAGGERWSKRAKAELQTQVHPELDRLLGLLLDEATSAACRIETALARIPTDARPALADAMYANTLRGGDQTEMPVQIGSEAVRTAARLWSHAVVEAAIALAALPSSAWPLEPTIWKVGLGEVWVGSPGANSGRGDPFLLVDPGGDDHWRLRPDATSPGSGLLPVRAWIDLGGDDVWRSGVLGAGGAAFGVGFGVDVAGDDLHASAGLAAGGALLGIAGWLDLAGDDRYRVAALGLGAAVVGAALLRDLGNGSDRYDADRAAQGFGRAWGAAALHDAGGDDAYKVAERGAGCGEEGGVGRLVDDAGDDAYSARAYGLGSGVGLLATGVVRDGGGDDRYAVGTEGAGFGRDGLGLLLDADGNDVYSVGSAAGGVGDAGGVGFLVDLRGADDFVGSDDSLGFALAPDGVGLLIDADGRARWLGGSPAPLAGRTDAAPRGGLGGAVGRDSVAAGPTAPAPAAPLLSEAALLAALTAPADLPERPSLTLSLTAAAVGMSDPGMTAILGAARNAATASDPLRARDGLSWLGALALGSPRAASEAEEAAAVGVLHPDSRVRAAAWEARAALGRSPALAFAPAEAERLATAAAVAVQNEETPLVRAAAARTAGVFGAAGVASSLAAALSAPSFALRRAAEDSLLAVCARSDGVAVARALYALAAGESGAPPAVRDAGLRVLGATRQRDALPILLLAVADSDEETSLAAAIGLSRHRSKAAEQALSAWAAATPGRSERLRTATSSP